MAEGLARLRSKSAEDLSIAEHTVRCLKAAKALLDSLPFPPEQHSNLREDLLLAVSLHDTGKAAEGMQRVLRGEQRSWDRRHEVLSAALASSVPNVPSAVVFAILTHHKSIPSDGVTEVFDGLRPEQLPFPDDMRPVWQEMAEEWRANLPAFRTEMQQIAEFINRPELAALDTLSPLSIWAELQRSAGRHGQLRAFSYQDRLYLSLLRGLMVASDHLGSADLIPLPVPRLSDTAVLSKPARPFQSAMAETAGSALLRAPTGSGKTEAALLWAQHNQQPNGRLFYCLPFTASINAMHRRLQVLFGSRQVGLLHNWATAAIYQTLEAQETGDKLEAQQAAKQLAGLAREVWFPVKVCTPHQIVRHTLRGKGWENMLIESPGSCIIFDEVHAYDPRMVGLTLASAKLFQSWGARCLFMSATLPKFLEGKIRESLSAAMLPVVELNPANPTDAAILNRRRHKIRVEDGSIDEWFDRIVIASEHEDSVLLICNHIKTAQDTYTRLLSHPRLKGINPSDVVLLHSRFCYRDRARIEARLDGQSQLPRILVATQVVEVSLDLDFGCGFTEPAPVDALVQRMGRINRFGSRPPADVVVFTRQVNPYNLYCACKSSSGHDATCRVACTLTGLRQANNPLSETDLVGIADKVYAEGYLGKDKDEFEQGLNHPDIARIEENLLAGASQEWVDEVINRADNTVELLPACLIEEYEQKKEAGLWVEARRLLVPVRSRALFTKGICIERETDPWHIHCEYDECFGLRLQPEDSIL